RDFPGLVSSACALARAAAMVPMVSLERCMAALHAQEFKAHCTGFGSFGPDAMADRLLGVLGHKGLELRLEPPRPRIEAMRIVDMGSRSARLDRSRFTLVCTATLTCDPIGRSYPASRVRLSRVCRIELSPEIAIASEPCCSA